MILLILGIVVGTGAERLFGVFYSELHTTYVFKTTKLENKIFQSLGNSPSRQLSSRKISNVSFAG